MFAISNNELAVKPRVRTFVVCKDCGKRHRVFNAPMLTKDGRKVTDHALHFYRCRIVNEAFLVGINGREI